MNLETLWWEGDLPGFVSMVDQTLLPQEMKILRIADKETMSDAIQRLAVRGAPAIGVAGAYGMLLGLQGTNASDGSGFLEEVAQVADYLAASRPTAVNLFHMIDRMKQCAEGKARAGKTPAEILVALKSEALAIHAEDKEFCAKLGEVGSRVLSDGQTVLTHCHAGILATGGRGTALSVIYHARDEGKTIKVFADETRPLLQGARLTSWELMREGIDVTLLCDNAAATAMARGLIDVVITGADRIAANGDAANKIGTFSVAVLAKEHGIPFYVVAPSSTFDMAIESGREIPIEERDGGEVRTYRGQPAAPADVKVFNPAFDVTPAKYITGIVTELGLIESPTLDRVRTVLEGPKPRVGPS